MVKPTLNFENNLWNQNHNYICGIDEVGRGSWAGPLVVAGVILKKTFILPKNLADSKLVTKNHRSELSRLLKNESLGYYVSQVPNHIIDKIGLTKATNLAFREVVRRIRPVPDYVLIDAFYIKQFNRKKQQAIKNGDKICASIAAASIIAKVFRDELMDNLHKRFPKYNFTNNKGYGTKFHQQAIVRYGLTSIHRKSYNLDFLYS